MVSTHSRAEAAAAIQERFNIVIEGFNTQPRGGGCGEHYRPTDYQLAVSTHSRAEAAAPYIKKQEKSAN